MPHSLEVRISWIVFITSVVFLVGNLLQLNGLMWGKWLEQGALITWSVILLMAAIVIVVVMFEEVWSVVLKRR